MRNLFYSFMAMTFLVTSCTSESSSDRGELKKAATDVKIGEAGKLTFLASDGLLLTADYYPNDTAEHIIILCHQAKFSRGEYKDLAPGLVRAGFSCFALDQRSGNMANEVLNESAQRAMQQGLSTKYADAKVDIESAIDFVSKNTDKEIYLWGSSYSASLSLIIGNKDERVKKIVAFSPGEFLGGQNTVKAGSAGLSKPTFITGSQSEYDLIVAPIVSSLSEEYVTAYKQVGQSDHGSKTLFLGGESAANTTAVLMDFLL